MTTAERDHHQLHDEQKRLVPLSLLVEDARLTRHSVYLNRAAIKATVTPYTPPKTGKN